MSVRYFDDTRSLHLTFERSSIDLHVVVSTVDFNIHLRCSNFVDVYILVSDYS
jgi:hypothetical protein